MLIDIQYIVLEQFMLPVKCKRKFVLFIYGEQKYIMDLMLLLVFVSILKGVFNTDPKCNEETFHNETIKPMLYYRQSLLYSICAEETVCVNIASHMNKVNEFFTDCVDVEHQEDFRAKTMESEEDFYKWFCTAEQFKFRYPQFKSCLQTTSSREYITRCHNEYNSIACESVVGPFVEENQNHYCCYELMAFRGCILNVMRRQCSIPADILASDQKFILLSIFGSRVAYFCYGTTDLITTENDIRQNPSAFSPIVLNFTCADSRTYIVTTSSPITIAPTTTSTAITNVRVTSKPTDDFGISSKVTTISSPKAIITTTPKAIAKTTLKATKKPTKKKSPGSSSNWIASTCLVSISFLLPFSLTIR